MANGLIPALRAAGFDDHVIAGIVANADHESGGDPTAIGDDGTSVGLWQWHGPRAQALMDFADKRGISPKSVDAQVAFLQHELTANPDILTAMNDARSPEAAAAIFTQHFERPANVDRQMVVRAKSAAEAFAYMQSQREQGAQQTAQGGELGPPAIVSRIEKAIAPYTEPLGRGVLDFVQNPFGLFGGSPAELGQEAEYQARGGTANSPLRTAGAVAAGALPFMMAPGAGAVARGAVRGAAKASTMGTGGAGAIAGSALGLDPLTSALVGAGGAKAARVIAGALRALRPASKGKNIIIP